jgi:thioredoxin reductase
MNTFQRSRPEDDGNPAAPPRAYDVIIVGGGPAGLNAALILGRARRSVLVCDDGRPRNAVVRRTHGFLTRDGADPKELLRLAREEVARYGVTLLAGTVTAARRLAGLPAGGAAFEVTHEDGRTFRARKLLLATGVEDVLPDIPGVREYFGRGVFHCPYCDGWEHRDRRLVAFGDGAAAVGLALSLRSWSAAVTACPNGEAVSDRERRQLKRLGIALRPERVAGVEGENGLERVTFEEGGPLACDAFFFNTGKVQRSPLPASLGCERNDKDELVIGPKQCSRVPGVFVAGDADGHVQFVVVAAAEGATAAVAINRELQEEDRAEQRRPRQEQTA